MFENVVSAFGGDRLVGFEVGYCVSDASGIMGLRGFY